MRKFLLIGLLLPLLVGAQTSSYPVKSFHGVTVTALPPELSYDSSKPVFFMMPIDERFSALTVSVINEDLDVIDEFENGTLTYNVTTTYSGPKLSHLRHFDIAKEESSTTFNQVLDEFKSAYGDDVSTYSSCGLSIIRFEEGINDELKAIIDNPSIDRTQEIALYMSKHSGTDHYALFFEETSSAIFYSYAYTSYTGIDYNTNEIYFVEDSKSTISVPYILYTKPMESVIGAAVPATQTLFNNDSDYEILIPYVRTVDGNKDEEYGFDVPVTTEYGDGTTDTTYEWVSGTKRTQIAKLGGLQAVNAKTRQVIATFNFPVAIAIDPDHYIGVPTIEPTVEMIGEKMYMFVNIYDAENSEDVTYAFDLSTTSSINSPVMTRRVTVMPTVVNRGESINISTDPDNELKGVKIYSPTGSTEHKQTSKGQTETISTSHLAPGMHIVGVTTTATHQPSYTKVIVR